MGPLKFGFGLTALALAGCGSLLPHETTRAAQDFQTYSDVEYAYRQILPGITRGSQLAHFRFYVDSSPNVLALSYLGVMERFMPNGSVTMEQIDPPVRNCIEARQNCTGYVFKLEQRDQQRVGNVALDVLSFSRTTHTTGWSAEVVLLVNDGAVTYKLMSGNPNIDEQRKEVQPLGPLQDLGETAVNRVAP